MGTFPSLSRLVTRPIWFPAPRASNHQGRSFSAHELAGLFGRTLPGPALTPLLGRALEGLQVSLCLHRVAPRPRPTDWQRGLSMPADELDTLIELLLSSRPGRSDAWLSVTFDDGYRDAGEYVRTRAARFPQVEFLFFVCPEKAERRVGFRWDLVEERIKAGLPRAEAVALMKAPAELERENERAELAALTTHPDYALCTVAELGALAALPNVTLGNHTSLHLSSQKFPDEVVKADFERSTAAFTRLFGAPKHFAFPFGTPGLHFRERHVAWLRALGDFTLWSTEARPYRPEERTPQAVLPRFPIDGSQDARSHAGVIAAKALQFRLQRSR